MESIVARAAFSVASSSWSWSPGLSASTSFPRITSTNSSDKVLPSASRSLFRCPSRSGVGALPLIITRQKLSDTRRLLSVQLGRWRGHESAWCLLGFAGGNHANRAGFRHVFSDPHCLFSRNALLFHFTFRLWPAASEGKEQHRTP